MNKNTEYEKFTQDIYQSLINAQGINSIEILHDVKIKGKSSQEHQIDVYWEYEIAGVKHKVAIECKNYNKNVSIGKVRDFYSVLSDLNNVNGIMVTKIGYQKGAKKYAEHYGINLKELRFPIAKDWKGRIKKVNIQLSLVISDIKERTLIFDEEWINENIKTTEQGNIQGLTNEIFIRDEFGNPINNFQDLDAKVPHKSEAAIGLEHTFDFENAYIDFVPIGKVKIKGIKYLYDIIKTTPQNLIIDGEETVKAILNDAITNEIKFFNKDGNIK
jgi:hypothetical protein